MGKLLSKQDNWHYVVDVQKGIVFNHLLAKGSVSGLGPKISLIA